MMTYSQAIDFLFNSLPAFEKGGAGQYKPGLDTARALAGIFGNPHSSLRSIHIAGTNGKGSTASTLAAVLQASGYKVGLYTSPHIFDFRERIRINGTMISEAGVVNFVSRYMQSPLSRDMAPTFFELTTIMAFEHFARNDVDYAVIETGLGGRLDTTNIIYPILSIITNISLDHTDLLGGTIAQIATEKAGIIKPGIPVVIGEASVGSDERTVFEAVAREMDAPIIFAQDINPVRCSVRDVTGWVYDTVRYGMVKGELAGECQPLNATTVLTAIDELAGQGVSIPREAVAEGMSSVKALTGLLGRWSVVSHAPVIVVDTAHNIGGWQYNARQLAGFNGQKHLVLGFVADKDVTSILRLLPRDAHYYFATPGGHRALPASALAALAAETGIAGEVYDDVNDAFAAARDKAAPDDMIFIGGSNYLVAELRQAFI